MDELDELLRKRIPDDLVMMAEHAKRVDGYRYMVAMGIVDETRKLTEEKNRFKMIKSPSVTEADRAFYTELHTREQKAVVDKLVYTLQCIDKRINLIQTLVKPETEMFKRS